MTHLLKRSGFYRNLQDWHDFWLLEGVVHWLREGRLLIYDLREIPGSWNPVVLVRGDAEWSQKANAILRGWINFNQQRLVDRAWRELTGLIGNGSAGRVDRWLTPPKLSEHVLGRRLLHSIEQSDWQTTIRGLVGADARAGSLLDEFWIPELKRARDGLMETFDADAV